MYDQPSDTAIEKADQGTAAIAQANIFPQSLQHPHFHENYSEAHKRPFPVQSVPLQVSHIALLADATVHDSENVHLHELCNRFNVPHPEPDAKCFYQNFGEFELRWERHFEFCTYTFLVHGQPSETTDTPFTTAAIERLPAAWLAALPGQLIAALHVEVCERPQAPVSVEQLQYWFDGERLIGSQVNNSRAEFWSAFQLHHDDFNRVLLFNHDLDPFQTGRLLRDVLELETYRIMSLLAFPLARQMSREVSVLEQRLANTVANLNQLKEKEQEQERQLLSELSDMAAEIAQMIAESRFRFDATQAYYALVNSRLEELRETEIAGVQTLSEFIDRRLTPAYRTVEATQRRMDDLARRIDRASGPLRTRIDMKIEAQNQSLLQSMNRRIELQLTMQQTVEGLSIVVISSCLVALFNQSVGATKWLPFNVDADLAKVLFVPVAVGFAWGISLRWKRHIKKLHASLGSDEK